ncbi:hypothetical protein [Streptomyces sp. NPDC046832]|uniref:hypothetical protein n=1 Tax=Streptomyces sp. NPDC046832 TaxID=3155020 RepID=UPI0033EE60B8
MLLAPLALAAVLHSWNLSGAGLNGFHSAAVLSGTESWKAWFFGSLDAGSSLTGAVEPARALPPRPSDVG